MSAPVRSRSEEFRALSKLALPIAAAQAGQALMGLVDIAVVGRVGTEVLAPVSLANSIFFAVTVSASGLMMGIDPLMSQTVGAGNTSRARVLLWQGSYLAVAVGALFAVSLMVGPFLLPLFGVTFDGLPHVQEYLVWRAPSLPFILLFITARGYLQAAARTRALVVAMVVANVFNLVANLLLVFGGAGLPAILGPLRLVPALGAKGSAIASLISSVAQWAIIGLAVRRIPVPGGTNIVWPRGPDIIQALRVGMPIGLHLAAEVGMVAIAGVLAQALGPASISAHQIASSLAGFTFTVAMGIGSAGGVRVGWAVGERNTPQARLSGMMAFISGAGFMMLSALVFALWPLPLARMMGAPPEVIPLVVPLLIVSAVFQFSDGVQGVGAGVLRGAGETRFTFLANMVGHYMVGLPVALLLGFHMGLGIVGIWWGLCAGLTAVALGLFWRFERVSAGTIHPLEQQSF
jgi:MATE family multidrug resistance protein